MTMQELDEGEGQGEEDEDSALPVASVVGAGPASASGVGAQQWAAPAMRRGFFDSRPARKQPARTSGAGTPGAAAAIPLLRAARHSAPARAAASAAPAPGRPAVPEFLMLPPDARQKARDQLLGALAPTQGMISQIASDPVLAAGFDDPEVMAAVAEVAADPSALRKHQGNAKVMRFYASMGQLVGGRLEEMGSAEGGKGGGGGGAERRQQAARPPAQQPQRAEVRWRE
ncbi:MAG: hypothetical protein J3K34DRAFT_524130 [Monoraphidium minutum]|nr:MAG: hypothetical protein J3K34DRAFT_524130 [Monoraphidium minutum]